MDEKFFRSKFDWRAYVDKYGDLRKANIDTEEKAWNHAKRHGRKKKENRDVFNGDRELLRLFRNFCISGSVKSIPDKYKKCNNQKTTIINENNILIVMPTYNRSENIEKSIEMINNQSYKNWTFLIIDDGSLETHKTKFKEIKEKHKNNNKLIFMENETNLHIAKTLNKGIQYLLDHGSFTHFTWISDDNTYYTNFIEELQNNNTYFSYSSWDIQQLDGSKCTNKTQYKSFNDLLDNFNGCASFMWTRQTVQQIGYYTENINGCEDYEYLLRTFKLNKHEYKHINIPLMKYIRSSDNLFMKDKDNILNLKSKINQIYNHFNNNNDNSLLYYSKTNYNLLFQRPQQIMRFFDKSFNKCFIGTIDNIIYEDKYNLLVVPYKYRDLIYNSALTSDIITYYTDSRLYNEIINRPGKKIYDLIDAPIGEFEVWKPNLENCVKKSDYVTYSHPDLVKFLNEIDNTKQYTYISNACDYEHFSTAKQRIGQRPSDFPQTDKPILGYYGAFSEWLDYDIIRKYADENVYHIIMIGGISGNSKYNMRFEHANITWLDHKSYHELPYYLCWFDKCFLPFKDCELTKYVNPCKLWEYMASGKEIIKHNVNILIDKNISYKDVCNELYNKIKYFTKINVIKPTIGIITNMYLHWDTLKPSVGGGERYCNELIKILKNLNFDIELHQLGKENLIKYYNDIKIHIHKNKFTYNDELATGFSNFINEYIKNKYSFVIYMMPELCCSDNIIKNSILINHGIWFDRKEKNNKYYELLKQQIINCKQIICVDTNYINFTRSMWGYNFNNNKFKYIPNFVEDDYIINKNDKNYNDKLTILFPRRANIYRGSKIIPYLLDNIKDDVNFIWCGDGEDSNKFKSIELTDKRFSFVTSDFDKIINYYKKSNIVVIPTIASEGTSLSCIEGMATYNIVLSTDVGGLPNLIIDNFNGYLCNNTKESICYKLKYIINNYNNINEKICNNAQNVVKESFLKTRWNTQITDIIKKFDIREKKIAIVTKNCINGGVESIINLHKQILKCDVFICNGKIDNNNKPFEFTQNLKTYNEAIEYLKEYDIIISHWVPNFIQNAYNELTQKNTIIEFVHREDTNDNKKYFLNGIITHSNFLKQYIKNNSNFDETKIYTLNHPIDTQLFKPKNNKEKKKIGIIGSYNQFKGIDIFIQAINLIKNNPLLNNYELCIYGKDDGYKNEYNELAKSLKVSINFYDSTNKVNELLNQFEILCIPSTLEGFPVILCEALSCNTKIIASDIIGIKECYDFADKNKYNNLFCLFESQNYKELSNNIINILMNKIILNNEKGNDFIENYYSLNSHIINLNNIIYDLYEETDNNIEYNINNYKNNISNINDLKKHFKFLDVDVSSINIKSNKIEDNLQNINFTDKLFLRLHNLNNTLIKFKLIIELHHITKYSNFSINKQLDILDDTNKLYYDIDEEIISFTNNKIYIEVNLKNNHKLRNINIIPRNKINIKNISMYY